jgi:hypothetical protein
MAHYKIEIAYTSNKDKAGKVTIKDDSDKIIVKSDAILPNWMHELGDYASELELHKFIFTDYSQENKSANVNAMSQYYQLLGNYYITDKASQRQKDIRIIQKKDFDTGKVLKGTESTINFSTSVFENIKFMLLNEENKVSIKTNKKRFIWGQKPCERDYDSSHSCHIELGEEIAYKEKEIQRKKEHEDYLARMDELNKLYPHPSLPVNSENEERLMKAIQNIPPISEYVNPKRAKKVKTSNSRTVGGFSNHNPHQNFQQIYQSVEQQYTYDSSPSRSCNFNSPSSRHESSNDSCGYGGGSDFSM